MHLSRPRLRYGRPGKRLRCTRPPRPCQPSDVYPHATVTQGKDINRLISRKKEEELTSSARGVGAGRPCGGGHFCQLSLLDTPQHCPPPTGCPAPSRGGRRSRKSPQGPKSAVTAPHVCSTAPHPIPPPRACMPFSTRPPDPQMRPAEPRPSKAWCCPGRKPDPRLCVLLAPMSLHSVTYAVASAPPATSEP